MVAADLNHDGRIDLLAVSTDLTELIWFENPTWERHVIASGLHSMINAAVWDIDGDGIPEIALAHEFSMTASKSLGIVSLLEHDGDPRKPWKIREIDRLPTSHRLRWADTEGDGKKLLINAPLIGATAKAPDYRGPNPISYYHAGEWKRRTVREADGLIHGIYIVDWDGKGHEEILSAGFEGIYRNKAGVGESWMAFGIAPGNPAPWPKSGASDVAVGKAGGSRFVASIEPWHGNQVVVYREHKDDWNRDVIDSSLADAHTILTADLDGDGNDEIVAGFRGKPQRVYIYRSDGARWTRQTLEDGGVAAASCAVADLNGDGKPDIACIGSATHNLKWYENRTPAGVPSSDGKAQGAKP